MRAASPRVAKPIALADADANDSATDKEPLAQADAYQRLSHRLRDVHERHPHRYRDAYRQHVAT